MSLYDKIRNRILVAHPDHLSIAKDMALLALFVLFASFARAAREMAIAYRYGVGAEVDAYLFVFNLTSWPIGVWLSLLTVVLVPLMARIRHESVGELPRFRSELLGFSILFGIMLSFLGWLTVPAVLSSSWAGLPEPTLYIASKIAPMLVLVLPLGVIISLFSVWMMASGRHANTLMESVSPLVLLIVLMAFPDYGIEPLVWGTLAGLLVHLMSLGVSLKKSGNLDAPCYSRKCTYWAKFWHGFSIVLTGQLLMSFTNIVDQFFAAHLGVGAIAVLSYSNRVLSLILGLGATTVSRATLHIFSRNQAHEQLKELKGITTYWAYFLFGFGIVAMILGWLFAPFGVKLLFERGAFSAGDTEVVTEVIRYGLSQLPFYFSSLVFVSYLSSRSMYKWILVSGILGLSSKLLSNAYFIPFYGVNGVVMATAVMYATNLMLFVFVYKKYC